MAYKSKMDQARAARIHYEKNKDALKQRARRHTKKQAAKLRDIVQQLKSVPCRDCGQRFPSCVMDFDHCDGQKIDNVSSMAGQGGSVKKLLDEIEKCEVVCANCHRIRTHSRRIAGTKPANKVEVVKTTITTTETVRYLF